MTYSNKIFKLARKFELKIIVLGEGDEDDIMPHLPDFDPNNQELINHNASLIDLNPPALLSGVWRVSHSSSNLNSIIQNNGFEQRLYGISFARQPIERIPSPTINDSEGNVGVVFAEVTGKGLDYTRKEHKDFIDSIYEFAQKHRINPIQDVVFQYLKSIGVDWVNGWNGIGKSNELHVLNSNVIKITRVLPISDKNKLRKLPKPRWFEND